MYKNIHIQKCTHLRIHAFVLSHTCMHHHLSSECRPKLNNITSQGSEKDSFPTHLPTHSIPLDAGPAFTGSCCASQRSSMRGNNTGAQPSEMLGQNKIVLNLQSVAQTAVLCQGYYKLYTNVAKVLKFAFHTQMSACEATWAPVADDKKLWFGCVGLCRSAACSARFRTHTSCAVRAHATFIWTLNICLTRPAANVLLGMHTVRRQREEKQESVGNGRH